MASNYHHESLVRPVKRAIMEHLSEEQRSSLQQITASVMQRLLEVAVDDALDTLLQRGLRLDPVLSENEQVEARLEQLTRAVEDLLIQEVAHRAMEGLLRDPGAARRVVDRIVDDESSLSPLVTAVRDELLRFVIDASIEAVGQQVELIREASAKPRSGGDLAESVEPRNEEPAGDEVLRLVKAYREGNGSSMPADPEVEEATGVYVYGIGLYPEGGVEIRWERREGPAVSVLRHRSVAALVSVVVDEEGTGSAGRQDRRTCQEFHDAVIRQARAAGMQVYALRPGVVYRSSRHLVDELLAKHHDSLVSRLPHLVEPDGDAA